jgi:hypothetical protein
MFTPQYGPLNHSNISKINECRTRQELTLALLMTRILANDAHDTLAADYFAVAANALH